MSKNQPLVVIAPDSFKESASAKEVGESLKRGFLRAVPEAECRVIPMADGGEGTVDAITGNGDYVRHEVPVEDPLGRTIQASYAYSESQKTGIVEFAAASGLSLLARDERDPARTSSYGTGQLIRHALSKGAKKIVIGLGGSATNDAAVGLLQALGISFCDESGNELVRGGLALGGLHSIDSSGLVAGASDVEFVVACDVSNPVLGPEGATATYGPQKGASQEQLTLLESALSHLLQTWDPDSSLGLATLPGGGAAGGAAIGLVAGLGARLKPGVTLVAEACGLETGLQGASLVITGEGVLNWQTVNGKVPAGVYALASSMEIPVIAVCGGLGKGWQDLASKAFDAVFPIAPGPISLDESLANACQLLEDTGFRIGLFFRMR